MSRLTIRNLIIASLFLLVSLGAFGYMVKEIGKQGNLLSERVQALSKQRSQESSFYRLQKISEDSVKEREKLTAHFLQKESDSIDFLNQVESLAPEVGVNLKTENLKEIIDKNGKSWIEVNFSFSGSKQRVQNFIDVLENLPYLSQVTSVSLSSGESAVWQAKVVMQVHVLSYDK